MRRVDANEWMKLPGLFFRWEFPAVTHTDAEEEFRTEQVGYDDRGVPLFAIHHRPRAAKESEQ
jgi:hypothetical protein